MTKDIKANSLTQVDVKNLVCPIIAIYIKPDDYPDQVVARVFDMENPTNTIVTRDTLDDIRADIQEAYPWTLRFDRAKNDALCIAETWI